MSDCGVVSSNATCLHGGTCLSGKCDCDLRYFGRYCEDSWETARNFAYIHQFVLLGASFILMMYAASRTHLVCRFHASRLKNCAAYFTDNAVVCVVLCTIYPAIRCAQYVDPFGFHGYLPDWISQTLSVFASTMMFSAVAMFLRIFVVVHAKLHKPSRRAVTAVDILAVIMVILHLATLGIYPASYTLYKTAVKALGAINIVLMELYGVIYALKVLNPLLDGRFDSPATAVFQASLTLRRIIYIFVVVGICAALGIVLGLIFDPGYRDPKNVFGIDMYLTLLQLTIVTALTYIMARRAAAEKADQRASVVDSGPRAASNTLAVPTTSDADGGQGSRHNSNAGTNSGNKRNTRASRMGGNSRGGDNGTGSNGSNGNSSRGHSRNPSGNVPPTTELLSVPIHINNQSGTSSGSAPPTPPENQHKPGGVAFPNQSAPSPALSMTSEPNVDTPASVAESHPLLLSDTSPSKADPANQV